MAAFSDPFPSLPGTIANLEDGNLTIFNEKTGPAVLVLGTAVSGPSATLTPVDRVSEAISLFGTGGTLSRGLAEAAQGGAENIVAYRIGAEAATMRFIGDQAWVDNVANGTGFQIVTAQADSAIADDFRVLYEEAEQVVCTRAAGPAYTSVGDVKRLRVLDSNGNLVYDNDPVGGIIVDTGAVVVTGASAATAQGPSVGDNVRARGTDQHNLWVDETDLGANVARSIGGGFLALNFNATTAPMKLVREVTLQDFEECNILSVTNDTDMTLSQNWPAASNSVEEAFDELSAEITNQPLAATTVQVNNLDVAANNDDKRVTIYGVDGNNLPIRETIVIPAGGPSTTVGTTVFTTVYGAEMDVAAAVANVVVEDDNAGEDLIIFAAAGGRTMGLDTSVLDGGQEGLFGALGLWCNAAGGVTDPCVVRGPDIDYFHTMSEVAAGDEFRVVTAGAHNDDTIVTVYGYDINGWPTRESVTIAGGPATQNGAVIFRHITGVSLSHPCRTSDIDIQERNAPNTRIHLFDADADTGEALYGHNMLAERMVLGATATQADMVSSLSKFSGIQHIESGLITAAGDPRAVKLHMFRVVRRDVGEVMSISEWNDQWAETSVVDTNTTSRRGIRCSPLVVEGADNAAPSKERLFEYLQDAYRALEAAPVDIVLPMGGYLDDLNVADDATLATVLDSGADGAFNTANVDDNGLYTTFTSAGGGFNALNILGANRCKLVITEATFNDAAGLGQRRSAEVLRRGTFANSTNTTITDQNLLLDRALVVAQTTTLDWELVGAPAFAVSDHLRYFRQYQLNGQWLYEWWHEADQSDPDADSYVEVNFAYQLANFCYQLSTNDNNALGVMGVNIWDNRSPASIANWLGEAPISNAAGTLISTNGNGLLGNKYTAGTVLWDKGMFANTALNLGNFPADTDIIVDTNGNSVDIGKYLSIVAAWPNLSNSFDTTGNGYLASGSAVYAGLMASLDANRAPTNKNLPRGIRMPIRLGKADRNRLAAGRFVWFNVSDRGVTVDDSPTGSLVTSDYNRLTTMRIVNASVDEVRRVASPFIGEAHTSALRAAMQNAIEERLAKLLKLGFLRRFSVTVSATPNQQILGLAVIDLVLVPAFELRKISITVSLARE